MAKKKFYVVWKGHKPGVYTSWSDCQAATKGYSNAQFKGFSSREEAESAFQSGPDSIQQRSQKPQLEEACPPGGDEKVEPPVPGSLCVDAACNTETMVMEYQGVWLDDGVQAFHQGPFDKGTNNIGEFLAIVHALAYLKKQSHNCVIYTDSATAISWVKHKFCNSKVAKEGRTSRTLNNVIDRAQKWLRENAYENRILKWETKVWGEIPADFGRK